MTKERLKGCRALRREAQQLRERLDEIESVMYAPKNQRLNGMPGGGASETSAAEAMVVQHLTLTEHYRAKLTELAAEQLAVEEAIDRLGTRERILLRYRYLQGLSWEEVCVAMSYSWRQVHRLHARALQTLREQDEEVGA